MQRVDLDVDNYIKCLAYSSIQMFLPIKNNFLCCRRFSNVIRRDAELLELLAPRPPTPRDSPCCYCFKRSPNSARHHFEVRNTCSELQEVSKQSSPPLHGEEYMFGASGGLQTALATTSRWGIHVRSFRRSLNMARHDFGMYMFEANKIYHCRVTLNV